MPMLVFWIVKPCGFVGRYQSFGGTYCLNLHDWKWRQYVPSKRWYLPTSPHGVETQKANIDIFIVMRTSNISTDITPHTEYYLFLVKYSVYRTELRFN
jgi:hypothetical protein